MEAQLYKGFGWLAGWAGRDAGNGSGWAQSVCQFFSESSFPVELENVEGEVCLGYGSPRLSPPPACTNGIPTRGPDPPRIDQGSLEPGPEGQLCADSGAGHSHSRNLCFHLLTVPAAAAAAMLLFVYIEKK